jgi:hypothetical protein
MLKNGYRFFYFMLLAFWQCVVVGRDGARMHGLWGGVWRAGRLRFAALHHHEGMPVQAEAWRTKHCNALPGCLSDRERKGETRKGSVADCGFRNKRTVFCGMASMPLKNRPMWN